MKKLIISANPSSEGFTHKIAKKIIDLSTEKGDEVKILDLYNSSIKQDYLNYEEKSEIGKDQKTKQIQELILWAEELVFIFPIWWGDAPAIMKNFFDCNFTAGFAYKFEEGGKSKGLLTGKTARIIATSGAPAFVYKIIFPLPYIWKNTKIGFCGIKQKSFTIFGNMDRSKTDKEKYLKSLEKLI